MLGRSVLISRPVAANLPPCDLRLTPIRSMHASNYLNRFRSSISCHTTGCSVRSLPKSGANYLVMLEQQGVITSLLPALPHDYFPEPWTAAPEHITVGHKTRFLCQTGRMDATVVTLRP